MGRNDREAARARGCPLGVVMAATIAGVLCVSALAALSSTLPVASAALTSKARSTDGREGMFGPNGWGPPAGVEASLVLRPVEARIANPVDSPVMQDVSLGASDLVRPATPVVDEVRPLDLVEAAQALLRRQGFYRGPEDMGEAGDSHLRDAVMLWEVAGGQAPTGRVDEALLVRILDSDLTAVRLGKRAIPVSPDDEVRFIQQTLARAGYYPRQAVDGVYGPQTAAAIRNMRKRLGLSPIERIDLVLLAHLSRPEYQGKRGKGKTEAFPW